MYQPPHHREDRLAVQHALIRAHPFGTLVTLGSTGLAANSIPFILTPGGAFGVLQGHLARGNPQWRDFDQKVDALVIFQGPQRYITPSWYATKRETGKVVPTWNYAIVQARGTMRVVEDGDWLAAQIAALTRRMEEGRAEPWAVADAPDEFVAAQIKGIVGIEIPIRAIEGKWKVSQNRPAADRAGVVGGLRAEGDAASLAMAELVQERGDASMGSAASPLPLAGRGWGGVARPGKQL
jgi:transcriptional regulator